MKTQEADSRIKENTEAIADLIVNLAAKRKKPLSYKRIESAKEEIQKLRKENLLLRGALWFQESRIAFSSRSR